MVEKKPEWNYRESRMPLGEHEQTIEAKVPVGHQEVVGNM